MPGLDPEGQILRYWLLVKQPLSYNGLRISLSFLSLSRIKFKC